jgi:hypothetical protein
MGRNPRRQRNQEWPRSPCDGEEGVARELAGSEEVGSWRGQPATGKKPRGAIRGGRWANVAQVGCSRLGCCWF